LAIGAPRTEEGHAEVFPHVVLLHLWAFERHGVLHHQSVYALRSTKMHPRNLNKLQA
jgi:hypothetical protein